MSAISKVKCCESSLKKKLVYFDYHLNKFYIDTNCGREIVFFCPFCASLLDINLLE